MKNKILPVVLILLSAATLTYGRQDKLGVTLDLTYVSKWLSKGAKPSDTVRKLLNNVNFRIK